MLFVAIPTYDQKISSHTTRALLSEQIMATTIGLEMRTVILNGCSLITQARNQLCQDFLDTDALRMVFVDSDVSWEPGSLLKLASHKFDLVGGAYRHKNPNMDETYPVRWKDEPGADLMATDGCIEVDGLPGGFLCISRRALEVFKAHFPERAYRDQSTRVMHAFFTAPYAEGTLMGEDIAFCRDYQKAGGRVWLDPELALNHHEGPTEYKGHIGKWLKARHRTAKANQAEAMKIVEAAAARPESEKPSVPIVADPFGQSTAA